MCCERLGLLHSKWSHLIHRGSSYKITPAFWHLSGQEYRVNLNFQCHLNGTTQSTHSALLEHLCLCCIVPHCYSSDACFQNLPDTSYLPGVSFPRMKAAQRSGSSRAAFKVMMPLSTKTCSAPQPLCYSIFTHSCVYCSQYQYRWSAIICTGTGCLSGMLAAFKQTSICMQVYRAAAASKRVHPCAEIAVSNVVHISSTIEVQSTDQQAPSLPSPAEHLHAHVSVMLHCVLATDDSSGAVADPRSPSSTSQATSLKLL